MGIAFSYAPVARVKQVTRDRGTVYVDHTRLMKLHPSWQALDMMKKTLADMGNIENSSVTGVGDFEVKHVAVSEAAGSESLLREQLRTEVAREAVGALGELETERRQALERRSHTMRDDMAEEEARKLRLQAQEVETGVTQQLRTIAAENAYDRINAQLKLSALKAAGKTKGVDTSLVNAKINSTQSELDRINRISTAQSNETLAKAADGIDRLSTESYNRINATIGIYESGENRRIEEQIATARDQILLELDSYVKDSNKNDAFPGRLSSKAAVVKATGNIDRMGVGSSASELRNRIKQLEVQIADDVKRAAKKLGVENDVNVVFTRGAVSKDSTDDFAESMRRMDWGVYEPVMLDALGS